MGEKLCRTDVEGVIHFQAQLRAFVPLMLRYSTGRGKPGWSQHNTRPMWWPLDVPWANVRSDARSEEQKHQVHTFVLCICLRPFFCFDRHNYERLSPRCSSTQLGEVSLGGGRRNVGLCGGLMMYPGPTCAVMSEPRNRRRRYLWLLSPYVWCAV